MKHKVGDKIKIKTWNQMVEEFGQTDSGAIACDPAYPQAMEQSLSDEKLDRIMTIKRIIIEITGEYYRMEELSRWNWSDDMIDDSDDEPYNLLDPISDRFELMDFE